MNRTEFKRAIQDYRLDLQFGVADGLGTKLHPAYLDVVLPTDQVPALEAACAALGVRAANVAVGTRYGGSFRRICLRS